MMTIQVVKRVSLVTNHAYNVQVLQFRNALYATHHQQSTVLMMLHLQIHAHVRQNIMKQMFMLVNLVTILVRLVIMVV